MKKVFLSLALLTVALVSSAQQNVYFQTACHPQDVKHYDTQTLRDRFVMEKVMVADEINLTYSQYDRFIYGGAMPVSKDLKLETFDALKEPYFLHSRESAAAIWARIRKAMPSTPTRRSSSVPRTLRSPLSSTSTAPPPISTTRRSG